jgi:hypothetical protein
VTRYLVDTDLETSPNPDGAASSIIGPPRHGVNVGGADGIGQAHNEPVRDLAYCISHPNRVQLTTLAIRYRCLWRLALGVASSSLEAASAGFHGRTSKAFARPRRR